MSSPERKSTTEAYPQRLRGSLFTGTEKEPRGTIPKDYRPSCRSKTISSWTRGLGLLVLQLGKTGPMEQSNRILSYCDWMCSCGSRASGTFWQVILKKSQLRNLRVREKTSFPDLFSTTIFANTISSMITCIHFFWWGA